MDVFLDVLSRHRPFFRDAAFHAADALGVWQVLREGPASPATIADRLGLPHARRLSRLLDVLRLEGAVEVETRGGFDTDPDELGELGASPEMRLNERPLRLLREPATVATPPAQGWGRIAEVVRSDTPLDASASEMAHQTHLAEVARDAARRCLDVLARHLGHPPKPRLLDLGCGLGVWSEVFLARAPERRAVLVDRPAVLEAIALDPAVRERVELWPGDLRTVPLEAEHDIVLLANVVHLYDASTAREICRHAWSARGPGGIVVVKDLDIAAERDGPAAGVYFALNMALYTDGGDVHHPETIARWLEDAGAETSRVLRSDGLPEAMVMVVAG